MNPKVAIRIGIAIVVGFLLAFFLGTQCASAEDAPKTKYYDAQFVGTFDDWESTSGDKVEDVKYINDANFIFLAGDIRPPYIFLCFILDGDTLTSEGFRPPEEDSTITVTFLSTVAPDGTAWTLDKFNRVEGACADYQGFKIQSYQFYRQPMPIEEWDIVSAGLRATIQLGIESFRFELRVLRLEKVLNYVD